MKVKNEFKAGILILVVMGVLLFPVFLSDVIKNNENPTTSGQEIQNLRPEFSEQDVANFRTGGSEVSEQKLDAIGSRFSELGKWRLMVGLGKED